MTNHNEVQNVPSSRDIMSVWVECGGLEAKGWIENFARALLAKYGAPQVPLTLSISPDPRGVHVAVHQGSECVHAEAMEVPWMDAVPLFWYRPRGDDGLYEGPIHHSGIERVRKESDGWVPLYASPTPPAGEGQEPAAWRHSKTGCLYETEEEVSLADGDEWAEPLHTHPAPQAEQVDKFTHLQRWRDVINDPAIMSSTDARPAQDELRSLLRPAIKAPAPAHRKLPDLVVTLDGVPVADQAAGIREFDDACLRKDRAALSTPTTAIELAGVAAANAEGSGCWAPCNGCHELNEGHATGPFSTVMQCNLGGGCSECDEFGAVWDTTDYQAMADAAMSTPPMEGDALDALKSARKALVTISRTGRMNIGAEQDYNSAHVAEIVEGLDAAIAAMGNKEGA